MKHAPTIIATALAIAAATSCTKSDPLFCDENKPCTDPARPFCDLSGDFPESEGHGRTCIANPFDAGVAACETVGLSCEADTLLDCDEGGNVLSQTDCPLGCHDTEVRCNKLDPSNGLADFLDMAEDGPDIILGDGATIDTDTGAVINGDGASVDIPSTLLPAPSGGVAVRVFMVQSMTLGNTAVTGEPAIAVVSASDVNVFGQVILGSSTLRPGALDPDAGDACHAPSPPPNSIFASGGGGFGTPGARGGTGNTTAGGAGGSSSGSASLEPLRGGCSGGRGCTTGTGILCALEQGQIFRTAGGGAIQISSATVIRVGDTTHAGAVEAHGQGGIEPLGGGSGGAILLEAPTVLVVDRLGANGGGGGCVDSTAGDGTVPATANGAVCAEPENGSGGNGGQSMATPADGSNGSNFGGGGGGAVGRIRVNTGDGTLEAAGTISPTPSVGKARVR